MTMQEDRYQMMALVAEARGNGARQAEACRVIGFSAKTLQRWSGADNQQDKRATTAHSPSNKLTAYEERELLAIASA
jgi:transposase